MRITTVLIAALGLASYSYADHSDLMAKAIAQSRQRQSTRGGAVAKPAAAAAGKKGAPVKSAAASKVIDVDKLNTLIKSFDKTWVMPKAGSKEPFGSNFQYKKTCASIYKARPGACSQLGFGSMCFNYCFEKGDKVAFSCVDASDAAYCKSSSNFESYLTKYKKDAYKAKAYVHQMISRCFATSLCGAATILDAQPTEPTTTPKARELTHMKLTKSGSAATKKGSRVSPTTAATTTTTEESEVTVRPKPAKKVPEWQKLMNKGKTAPAGEKKNKKKEEEEEEIATTVESTTVVEEEEEVEVEVEEEEEEETTTTTTTRAPPTRARGSRGRKPAAKAAAAAAKTTTTAAPTTTTTIAATTARPTFKPLPKVTAAPEEEEEGEEEEEDSTTGATTAAPAAPEPQPESQPEGINVVATSRTSEKTPKERTFWNRFQPNTWYQSIHYLTNTGRR